VHVHTSSCCAVPLLAQCRVCEYAGCIWIVVVVVVIPIVNAIADSNNIEKIRIFFISNYRDIRYLTAVR
jgi:H+/gluconate symporter-like permease